MMEEAVTKETLTRLIVKYAIILIAFDIISRFGFGFIIESFEDVLWKDVPPAYSRVQISLLTNLAWIIMNSVIAIVVLIDSTRRGKLTWAVFALTIFSPWIGVIIFIITKVIDLIADEKPGPSVDHT
ncbi:MAG TPA: hypothetical protein PK325_18345 [Cyclobacteriaceae bacterium]|nr:hypothetical protein [Cyclobacteriaceae bacterium]HMV08420.1 hypothetical protein [Cyclobacteriaceae bacterium]HMX01193.1 hypothetical protein [Cyclobacteriaceae bacterium]HMX50596.1 hypothetical protein [Cyclobacteriaceae bacterium]HMY91995.1 hypothetical protein [Cyclobacteriaceae bacterium]